MLEMIKNLFSYTDWATPRVIGSLKTLPPGHDTPIKPFAHLLLAEKIWLLRLTGHDSSVVSPEGDLSLAECEALAEENRKGYASYLNSIDEAGLDRILHYKNTKGVEFHTPIKEVLLHLAFHCSYHRGQVASSVRRDGGTAVNTDYITFVRESAERH
jgi:uncharacterized damage-inducible protein DinB